MLRNSMNLTSLKKTTENSAQLKEQIGLDGMLQIAIQYERGQKTCKHEVLFPKPL